MKNNIKTEMKKSTKKNYQKRIVLYDENGFAKNCCPGKGAGFLCCPDIPINW